jgi:phosphoribosylglycinamide formyltransferase 1
MKRIVILISGRGSNMQAIVNACQDERWPAQVVAVVSNRPGAQGLEFAQGCGIATCTVDHQTFASREAFDAQLADTLDAFAPDVVVLAGFMRILTGEFVHRFEGRMLNVHPSLLPAFTGLHTHRRALQAGCKLAGATVHFVTAELDHGPIVAQAWVPILPGDTEALLSQRVLALEHQMYPSAVRWMVQDELRVREGVVTHTRGQSQLFFDVAHQVNISPLPLVG